MSDVAGSGAAGLPATEDSTSGGTPGRPSRRVLLVEDDVELSGAIRDVLRAKDCFVDVATTGADALRCVLLRGHHTVIIKRASAGIDGLELTRLLSRRIQSPHIVLMTASSDPEAIRDAYAAGASHVLPAPLSLTLLTRLVDTLVAPITAARTSRAAVSSADVDQIPIIGKLGANESTPALAEESDPPRGRLGGVSSPLSGSIPSARQSHQLGSRERGAGRLQEGTDRPARPDGSADGPSGAPE